MSSAKCVERLDAISDDLYGLYVYHTSKLRWYKTLVRGKDVSLDEMIERARAQGDRSFVKAIEAEVQTGIRIKDAIDMVLLFFDTHAEVFIKSHSQLLNMIKTTAKMTVVGGANMRFYEGHTQIMECRGSPNNISLYKAYHRLHHPEGGEIDDAVPSMVNNNQLIHHFEKTRDVAHFMAMGHDLKAALKAILEWTDDHIK